MSYIDTEKVSLHLREKAIDPTNRKILITNFHHTDQETDLTEPANCKGFGRVRHFKLDSGSGWPLNPLPIVPAARVLGIPQGSEMRAQVFQNSVCNWRCWYCFVDFKLLSGNKTHSEYLSCDELLDLYLDQDEPPSIIDLSGGQPDLTPEWVPWMIEALQARGLDDKTYLWSENFGGTCFDLFFTSIDGISTGFATKRPIPVQIAQQLHFEHVDCVTGILGILTPYPVPIDGVCTAVATDTGFAVFFESFVAGLETVELIGASGRGAGYI